MQWPIMWAGYVALTSVASRARDHWPQAQTQMGGGRPAGTGSTLAR
jgi:hypothetical protein